MLSDTNVTSKYSGLETEGVKITQGARGLHAPHPDGWPKAGKASGQYEANEVSEVLVVHFVLSARFATGGPSL